MLKTDSDKDFTRSIFYPLPRDLCFPVEKPLFKKWAAGKKSLVEIGVFEGCSAATFRSVMAPDATLHLIDPFIPDSMNPDLKARTFFTKLNVARIFNGQVHWYRDYSYNVVKGWNAPIDFLFIDGDHVEEHCRRDFDEWSRFVQPGGVVLFHDARYGKGDGSWWDGWQGPTQVVDKLFRVNANKNWEIVDEAGTLVVVRKKA